MGIALAIALLLGEPMPAGQELLVILVAGGLGGLGITSLYRGLAVGRMGVVAPVTAVLAAVIPVVGGIILEGLPDALVMLGIGIAIVAVVLVSRVPDEHEGPTGLREALVAGVAIGCFGITISFIGEGQVFSSLTLIRAVQAVLVVGVVILTRSAWRLPGRVVPAVVLIGILDMTGNACYLLAVQAGALAVASVLSSLYPVTTVLLAAFVLHERVTRDHAIGIALAVAAIVLIGIGST
jgi:drug/metabolite transporter (DMT)-like permease